MKRILAGIFALTVLVSCSDTDGVGVERAGGREIGFSITKTPSTRNTPTDSREFADGDDIYVTALHAKEDGGNEIYFEDVMFSKTSKDGLTYWGSSPEYEYPEDGALFFLAYSTAKTVAAEWTSSGNIIKVALPFGSTLDGKEDVTYSNYLKVNCRGVLDSPKPLAFSHALAWLNFKVKREEETPDGLITINSITVNDVSLSGTLELAPAISGNSTSVAAEWKERTAAISQPVPDFSPTLLGAEIGVGNGLMILPGSQTSFTINYTYDFGDGHKVENLEYTYPLSAADKWEMGKKYVYAITIGVKEITAGLESITDFTNGATNEIE